MIQDAPLGKKLAKAIGEERRGEEQRHNNASLHGPLIGEPTGALLPVRFDGEEIQADESDSYRGQDDSQGQRENLGFQIGLEASAITLLEELFRDFEGVQQIDDGARSEQQRKKREHQDDLVQHGVAQVAGGEGPEVGAEKALARRQIVAVVAQKMDFRLVGGLLRRLWRRGETLLDFVDA